MTLTESVRTCFNKYVTFKGRATRSEYWWFWLCVNVLVALVSLLIFALFNVVAVFFANIATSLAVSLPMWSVAVRRLHDTNHSGWWLLCPVYPIILMFMKGSEGENDYGAGESDLQLPCPICSELVDASASVCPHCGEATRFDLVEPASGTDRKVAIGVIAFCALMLFGGIAFSVSDFGKAIAGVGYDLGEYDDFDFGEEDVVVVDTVEAEDDDIVYPEYTSSSAVSAAEIDAKLRELAEFAKELQGIVEDGGVPGGSSYAVRVAENWDELSSELKQMRKYMNTDQERQYHAYSESIDYLFSVWE